MKPIVFVPCVILVPTPLTRRPNSFAKEVLQVGAALVCMRWRYSREAPVVGSRTAFIAADVSTAPMIVAATAYRDLAGSCSAVLEQMWLMRCWLRRVG